MTRYIVAALILAAVLGFWFWKVQAPPPPPPPPAPTPTPTTEPTEPLAQPSKVATDTYEGSVTSALGEALEGVHVSVRELPASTALSGVDGRFSVEVPVGIAASATFRKRGYASRTVPLAQRARAVVLHTGGTLVGLLEGSGGEAVAGARVEVAGFGGYHDVVTSDENGAFEASVAPGPMILTIHADDYADRRVLDIALAAGEILEQKFTLSTGTVVDIRVAGAGGPVRDARVRITTSAGDSAEGRSNSAGACRLAGLAAGKATVVITQPGFGERIETIDIPAPLEDGGDLAVMVWPVKLDPAVPWFLDVRTPAMKETTEVEVVVRRQRWELVRGAPESQDVNVLAAGRRYDIEVRAEGFPAQVLRWGPAANASTLKVVLEEGGRITGRVVDGGGAPLYDGRIVVTRIGARDPGGRMSGPDLTADPDADGRFGSALLAPGEYRVDFSHPQMGRKTVETRVGPGVDVDLGEVVLDD